MKNSFIPFSVLALFIIIFTTSLFYTSNLIAHNSSDKLPTNSTISLSKNIEEPEECFCGPDGILIDAGSGTTYSSLGIPTIFLQNECIKINGILIIDVPLVLIQGGRIILTHDSEIIIQNGSNLTLRHINDGSYPYKGIHSCLSMWEGITVESGGIINVLNCTFTDAKKGIKLMSGSTHAISQDTFHNNLISIIVPENQTIPVIINQSIPINANVFTSNFMLKAIASKPYAGIVINDATYVVGSSNINSVASNKFSNMENGIVGKNANLAVYAVIMENINETPQVINANPILGYGIHTENSTIRVELSLFDDVTIGIGLLGSFGNTYIENNDFKNNYVGITGLQGICSIKDNSFISYESRAVNLEFMRGEVSENAFIPITSYLISPPVGIAWSNTPAYIGIPFSGKIEDNSFNLGIYGMGIHLSTCRKFRIQDNNINYSPGYTPSPASGLSLSNSSGNQIKNNQVIGSSKGSVSAIGIRTLQSTSNLYCCNTLKSLGNAMIFSGNCNNSKIKYNEFGRTTLSSFQCDPATLIGNQPDHQNTWTGTFSSPTVGVVHAKHNGSNPFILSSHFFVNTCSTPLFPPTILPIQSCPSFGDWFITSINPPSSNCSNDDECAYSDSQGVEELSINENDIRYLNGVYNEEEYAEMVQWQMGKDLYQKLLRNNTLVNEDTEAFYNNVQNTAMGHLVQINETLQDASSISEMSFNEIEALIGQIEVLRTELALVDAEMDEDLSFEEMQILSAQRIAILSEINLYHVGIVNIMAQHNATAQSSYSSLLSLTSSVNVTTDIEIMEKEVISLLLQSLINPDYIYNQEEQNYLFSISGLCHLQYGSVVFIARSLYLRSENFHFDEDEICFPQVETKKENDEISETNEWKISINPNPASYTLNINWMNSSNLQNELTVILMDLHGKIVMSRNENAENGFMILDVSNYSSGIYLLQGVTNSGIQFTEKVVITK